MFWQNWLMLPLVQGGAGWRGDTTLTEPVTTTQRRLTLYDDLYGGKFSRAISADAGPTLVKV